MRELHLSGGTKIGWVKASFPFGRLVVTHDTLTITAPFAKKLLFTPADVISIEPYGIIPVLGQGIRIHHHRKDIQSKVVFYAFRRPDTIIEQIRHTGFLPAGSRYDDMI